MLHHRRILIGVGVLIAMAALPLRSTAQRAPSWVLAPAGPVAPAAVGHLGKMLFFADGGELHVFSAATRSWDSFPITPTAHVRNTNDWVLVADDGFVAAMSSTRGRFLVQPVSSQATIVNASTARNDGIALVLDGGTLWAFPGLVGRWIPFAVRATAQIAVQRSTAIVSDGDRLWAMSALHGTWVPFIANRQISTIGVGDTVGWATDGADAYGFSAIRNEWSSQASPSGASGVPQSIRDVAVWEGSTEVLAFSGVRGHFSQLAVGSAVNVTLAEHLAHVQTPDGRLHWLFSAPNADWTPISTVQTAAVRLADAVALITERGSVHAYSALTSTVATLAVNLPTSDLGASVAAIVEGAGVSLHLFSAMTGTWTSAPAGAEVVMPLLARNGALLRNASATMAWAYSARNARFVARPLDGNPTLHVNSGSSVLAVEDDGHLAVFEPRREVWLETPIAATHRPLAVRIWRSTLTACTPDEAIGYSPMHGTVERFALSGALLDQRSSSEVGAAITSGGVVGYSAVSDLRTEAQFPEFRRMLGRGSEVHLEATGEPAALVGIASGFARAMPSRIPGLGELVLDPDRLVPLPPIALDAEGLASIRLLVPDIASLRGLEFGFQGTVVPIGGSAYLTRACSMRIH
jgi:hypothetical protein